MQQSHTALDEIMIYEVMDMQVLKGCIQHIELISIYFDIEIENENFENVKRYTLIHDEWVAIFKSNQSSPNLWIVAQGGIQPRQNSLLVFWGPHLSKFAANGPECKVVQKARFKLNEMLSVVEWQKGEGTAPTTHKLLSSGSILVVRRSSVQFFTS